MLLIERLQVEGGFLDSLDVHFEPGLNVVIGPRGGHGSTQSGAPGGVGGNSAGQSRGQGTPGGRQGEATDNQPPVPPQVAMSKLGRAF